MIRDADTVAGAEPGAAGEAETIGVGAGKRQRALRSIDPKPERERPLIQRGQQHGVAAERDRP